MNAYGRESAGMKYSPLANFGKAELKHFGADTFMGHQELMGTLPKKPEAQPFQKNADSVADHGNDPLIGHSRHTREYVPLLLYKKGVRGRKLGTRNTLSDVGASVCGYFRTGLPQSGSSLLDMIH